MQLPFMDTFSIKPFLGRVPTSFSFPLASLLIQSIALHSLWFLNSVQHSMPEMFQKVAHILLISFPGVCISSAGLLKSSCCIPWQVASTCTSTWAALSSANFDLPGIVIGYSLSVQDMTMSFDTYVQDIWAVTYLQYVEFSPHESGSFGHLRVY